VRRPLLSCRPVSPPLIADIPELCALPRLTHPAASAVRSHHRHAVVIIERTVARAIAPVPVSLVVKSRSTAKLVLGHPGPVATEPGIVFQRLPGQRIMIVAEAQEAAETENRIGDPAADLVDHDALDRADLAVVGAIDGRTLDLIAADQIAGFTAVQFLSLHRHLAFLHVKWMNPSTTSC